VVPPLELILQLFLVFDRSIRPDGQAEAHRCFGAARRCSWEEDSGNLIQFCDTHDIIPCAKID
jgi:hypothetical protein